MHTLLRSGPYRVRVLLTLGVVLVAAAVFLACGGASGATTTSGSTSSSSSSPAASKKQQAAKVGDTITIDGVATTLVSVKHLTPGEFDTAPSAGKAYYVLHLKIVNKGSDPADFNEFEYKVLTGSGSTVDQSIVSTEPDDKLLQSGQVAPGGSVEGDLVYELGTKDHGAKLVWQPGLDTSLDHVWSLGL